MTEQVNKLLNEKAWYMRINGELQLTTNPSRINIEGVVRYDIDGDLFEFYNKKGLNPEELIAQYQLRDGEISEVDNTTNSFNRLKKILKIVKRGILNHHYQLLDDFPLTMPVGEEYFKMKGDLAFIPIKKELKRITLDEFIK